MRLQVSVENGERGCSADAREEGRSCKFDDEGRLAGNDGMILSGRKFQRSHLGGDYI